MACCGAAFFAYEGSFKILLRTSLVCSLLFVSFAIANTFLLNKQHPLIRLKWIKGHRAEQPLYEKWNSFSRITVFGNPQQLLPLYAWGLSSKYPAIEKVRRINLLIDGAAETILTSFDGNLNVLEHLKYDVSNIAHYLRQNAKVCIIGTGGGRDILSALAFGQKSIVGVEINKIIIDTVNKRFGDFTGHLDRLPNVIFINDEARSYIGRQKDRFDIIQASLIDTWAATASGAFVLTENSVYTVEAWKLLLERLTPNGILTFSRWYYGQSPGEVYRLTSLAVESLKQTGIKNPRDHIIILRSGIVGTILVNKKPFSNSDMSILEEVANKMQFEIVLSPLFALDSNFATIASGKNLDTFFETFPINVSAPTDDSPFFFNMLRLRNIFNRAIWDQEIVRINLRAVVVLGVLIITVIGLSLLCIIIPLILTTKKEVIKEVLPLFIYFGSIGFGFMLIEISQMQRLIIFLGHPTYSLSVVLFSLLLSSGIGSYSTQKITNVHTGKKQIEIIMLLMLICILIIFGITTPTAIREFQESTTVLRIFVAVVILSFLGFFMGMAFPIGMKIASIKSAYLTPWLWGINGATSVCASVFATAIALSSSISTSFWVGVSLYIVACCAAIQAKNL